jgi:hypothetical protein
MPKAIDPEERQKIVDLLHEHGGNRHKVANIAKRSTWLVKKIADEEGIPSTRLEPKKATEAHQANAEERRFRLMDKAYEKYEELLANCRDAQDFQRLQVAWGIIFDKDLLLSGKPTSINESRKGNEVTDLFGSLKGE